MHSVYLVIMEYILVSANRYECQSVVPILEAIIETVR